MSEEIQTPFPTKTIHNDQQTHTFIRRWAHTKNNIPKTVKSSPDNAITIVNQPNLTFTFKITNSAEIGVTNQKVKRSISFLLTLLMHLDHLVMNSSIKRSNQPSPHATNSNNTSPTHTILSIVMLK